jgi:hypothetical protein
MSKRQIIIGSTRPGRAADQETPWVIDRTGAHRGFEVEVLDWRDRFDGLEAARAKGQMPPAAFRIGAAAVAVDEVEVEGV